MLYPQNGKAEAVKVRREAVKACVLDADRRWRYKEIAEALGITQGTVASDISVLRHRKELPAA